MAVQGEAHLHDLAAPHAISSTSLHQRSFDTARWIKPGARGRCAAGSTAHVQ
jgi:hypothetical protein